MTLSRRYAILERVAASICEPRVADYMSLLCTDSGLPGPDFYVRFRRLHADRYYAALGVDRTRALKLNEKRLFAQEAREQVYCHCCSLRTARLDSSGSTGAIPALADLSSAILASVLFLSLAGIGLLASAEAKAQALSFSRSGDRSGETTFDIGTCRDFGTTVVVAACATGPQMAQRASLAVKSRRS